MNIRTLLGHYAGALIISLTIWIILSAFSLLLSMGGWFGMFIFMISWGIPIFIILGFTYAAITHVKSRIISLSDSIDGLGMAFEGIMTAASWLLGIGLVIAGIYFLLFEGYILWPFKKAGVIFHSINSWPLFLQIAIGVILGGSFVAILLAVLLNKSEDEK